MPPPRCQCHAAASDSHELPSFGALGNLSLAQSGRNERGDFDLAPGHSLAEPALSRGMTLIHDIMLCSCHTGPTSPHEKSFIAAEERTCVVIYHQQMAPGRNAAMVLLQDLGTSLDEVVKAPAAIRH